MSDFGLAWHTADSVARAALVGTCYYMAPELNVHLQTARKHSDIFSMAVTSIEWFTGRKAWHLGPNEKDHRRLLHERSKEQHLPEGLPDVVTGVRLLLAQCLNYNSRERPTASYMKDQLAQLTGAG